MENGRDSGIGSPLAFSARVTSKRKLSCFGEGGETSSKAKLSRYVNQPHLESSESEQLREVKSELEKLRKDYEELKAQNETILGHLGESQRAFANLNSAYESKCEETETLKSIVSSIKEHVFKEEKAAPLAPHPQLSNLNTFAAKAHNVTYTKSIIQNKPRENHVSCRRRVSIQETPIIMNADELGEMEENVKAKIEHYTKMKIVQSIKGSTYDIYS